MSIVRTVVIAGLAAGGVMYVDHKWGNKALHAGGKVIEPGVLGTVAVGVVGALLGVPANVLGPIVAGGLVIEAPKALAQFQTTADLFGLPMPASSPSVGKIAKGRIGVREFADGELVAAIRAQRAAAAAAPAV